MKGSTKLWLAVGIVAIPLSIYGQYELLAYLKPTATYRLPLGSDNFSLVASLLSIFNFISFIATLMWVFCELKPNYYFLWWGILAPVGVVIGVIVKGVVWGITNLFSGINKWADKNLGI